MSVAYAYDDTYEPAAAVVPLRIGVPADDMPVLVSALVDSGADLSVVPAALARQLDLPVTDVLQVRGVGGESRNATVHAAEVEIDGVAELIEVIALGTETLLGRNLLNAFVITLDGPHERVTVARA
ncbi:MAG: retroviral-like aspartic protease family protein [Egibacteraceae bacterium]